MHKLGDKSGRGGREFGLNKEEGVVKEERWRFVAGRCKGGVLPNLCGFASGAQHSRGWRRDRRTKSNQEIKYTHLHKQ